MTYYQQFLKDSTAYGATEEYAERIAALEAEGLTTSDAQGVADVEFIKKWEKEQVGKPFRFGNA